MASNPPIAHVQQLLNEAQEAIARSDWETAIARYESMLAVWPENETVVKALANARKLKENERERRELKGREVSAPPTPRTPRPTTVLCVYCGGQLPEDAKFCPHCGHGSGRQAARDGNSFEELCEMRLLFESRYFWQNFTLDAVVTDRTGRHSVATTRGKTKQPARVEDDPQFRNARDVMVNRLIAEGWMPLSSTMDMYGNRLPRFHRFR